MASESRSAAIRRLQMEQEAHNSPPPKIPRGLELSELHVEPKVFQVRLDGLDSERAEEISHDLEKTHLNDRIHTWWSGKRWIVIDGHHRFEAYRLRDKRGEQTIKVPVEAHPKMSLEEAMGAAGVLNTRDSVTISRAEKGNNAWNMVCLESGSIAETVQWAGVSKQQVSIMRGVLRRLKDKGFPVDHLIDKGWDWARKTDQDRSSSDYGLDQLELTAQEWATKIGRAVGGKAVDNPGALARALEIISPALPSRLIEEEPFWDALNGAGRALLAETDQEELENGDEDEDF